MSALHSVAFICMGGIVVALGATVFVIGLVEFRQLSL